jgi:predicted MPP superfamily phosphohydrolase
MRRTAILRFSDSESLSTIAAHREIIEDHGRYVWWGWWKKEKESPRLDFLKRLQSEVKRLPSLRIGLVNRKGEDSFYVADCVDILYREDGGRMPSPKAEITPEYYRNTSFPAWFKFRQIDSISLADFKGEFLAVPSIDPTLYEVIWPVDGDRDSAQVLPCEMWSMTQVEAPGEAILHVSDLHFGDYHGYPLDSPSAGREFQGRPLWEIISTRIRNERALPIGAVVVSGDLITRGNGNSYPHARHFIEKLLKELGLDKRHCIVVPGNHDMWTIDVPLPTRRYEHEQPYRDFVEGFFGAEHRDLERVRRFHTPKGRDLVFIELNSARLRNDDLKAYGFVAKHRYDKLLNFVCKTLQLESGSESPIIFVVLHHHLMPVNGVSIPEKDHPVSLCLDAGELLEEFQHHGVHFVLHGHQHAPFVGKVTPYRLSCDEADDTERPIHIIGCGSSGGRRDILPRDLDSNTFGIYTPNTDHLDVVIEKYTQTSPPKIHRHLKLPIVPWVPPTDLDGLS